MITTIQKRLGLFLLFFLFAFVFFDVAMARPHPSPKGIQPKQLNALFKPLIKRALKEPHLANQALPLKSVMSRVMLDLKSPFSQSQDLTDLLLNELLETGRFLVVNIDMDISNNSNLDAGLIHYDTPQTAARRGMSMGALYMIGAQVNEVTLVTGQGKLKSAFEASLWIEDLRKKNRVLNLSSTDQTSKARANTVKKRSR